MEVRVLRSPKTARRRGKNGRNPIEGFRPSAETMLERGPESQLDNPWTVDSGRLAKIRRVGLVQRIGLYVEGVEDIEGLGHEIDADPRVELESALESQVRAVRRIVPEVVARRERTVRSQTGG